MQELKNFITYKSSAGSGKTYTLVREFLRIVIESEDYTRYRNILAITFTNKAANEMKERVLSNLKELSNDNDSELLLNFSKEFQIDKSEVRKKSKLILRSILHNYSDLKILTIDKFTHKIIRAFSNDLGLNSDFEIEMDADNMLKDAIDLLISRAGNEEKISELLIEYLNQHIDQEKTWKIEENLFNFSKELLKEDNNTYLNKLRKLSDEELTKAKKFVLKKFASLEKQLTNYGKEAIKLINDYGLVKSDFSTIYNYYHKISIQDFTSFSKPQTKALTKAIEEDNWLIQKASHTAKSNIGEISEELRNIYYQLHDIVKEFFLFKLLRENIFNLILIKEIDQSISIIKEEGNILLISDFNKLISKSIKNQPAPFIYEKIGERYKNIMIDEFQDTSIMQWHNLLPLVDNSLSIGEKTLLVGDAKQAIYRFRGGKVEQFTSLPNIIDKTNDQFLKDREIALVNNHNNKELKTNYRSHSEIIGFNNWFFNNLSEFLGDDKKTIYEGQKQQSTNKDQGYVEISFLESEKEEIEEKNLEQIKLKIDECLSDGFSLKDITILVDKNKFGTLISSYLIENGYDVITNESLLIAENNEVNFLFNFLKYIQNNKNNTAKIELIKFFYGDDTYSPTLLKYAEKTNNRADIKLEKLLSYIAPDFEINKIYEMSLYDMVETISRTFIIKNLKTNAFLIKFLDVVHSYSNSVNDLKSFIEYFETKSDKISLETPDSDAITIMTVHKSKGLQFPVVISAFTNWNFYQGNYKPNVWVNLEEKYPEVPIGILNLKKDVELTDFAYLAEIDFENAKLDKFNMLYVALTRAEKRLYVICNAEIAPKSGIPYKDKINSYLYQICSTHDDFKENTLVFGERKRHDEKEKAIEKSLILEQIISDNWREKIRISKQYQELWGEKSYKSKIAYGNLIHNILSMVNTKSDIENAIRENVNQGLIKNNEMMIYQKEIEEIISIEGVKNWFTDTTTTLNEKEIIAKDGSLYRPDKIILMKEKTIVLDFKTGEKQDSYSNQLNNYGKLLEEMNYPNVEKYILFTRERELVKVN